MVQYLPSRVVIILNSFFIVPIFAHFLSVKEISVYLVSLQILNFICTCSYDWISKSVLRFNDKYLLENRIKEFFSTTFWISVILYVVIVLCGIFFREQVVSHFSLTDTLWVLTIVLVIPCGIRQFLYQILRIENRFWLYTISNILYQVLLVLLFLMIFKNVSSAVAIIVAMIIAISLIDLYIINSIRLKYPIELKISKDIVLNIFKYSIPLVVTNWCYWSILQLPGVFFQSLGQHWNTAVFLISKTLAQNVLQPIGSLFIFVSFPVIMRLFEKNMDINSYITNLFKMYLFIMLPLVCGVCFYSTELVSMLLDSRYEMVSVLLPIGVVSSFLHESLKLINLKYHIKVQTHIELLPAVSITIFAIGAYLWAIQKASVITVVLISMFAELLFLLINSCIKLKNFRSLKYSSFAKTLILMLGLGVLAYFIVNFILIIIGFNFTILKIILFLILNYLMGFLLKNRILN